MSKNSTPQDHVLALLRAAPPIVLSMLDLGLVFGLSPDAALKATKRGEFGPWFWQGRRVMILRETMLAHLEQVARENVERIAADEVATCKRRSARGGLLRKFGPPTGTTGGVR